MRGWIWFNFCKLWQLVFFLFHSLNVRASENLSDSQVFPIRFLVIRVLKPKISCFMWCFFCLTPLRLECSRIGKTALFLTSHRLKKYKNLHPWSFTEWSENVVNVENQFLKGNCKGFFQLSDWNEKSVCSINSSLF